MLTITQAVSDQIAVLDRARTDGGLGSVCVDGVFQCRDVRGDPNYAEYQDLLSDAEMLREGMEVSRLQARLALIQVELWPAVVAYFADSSRTEIEKAFFEDAQVWKRLDPTLQAACAAFEMTDEQVDDLFTLAATL